MNLGSVLSLISAIPGILAAVIPVISAVERLMPGAKGSDKKGAAADILVRSVIGADPAQLGRIHALLDPVIDSSVGFLNSTGVFSHGGPDPVPIPAAAPAAPAPDPVPIPAAAPAAHRDLVADEMTRRYGASA